MIIFIAIPLYYLWLGIVLPVTTILLSLGIATGFGFFATRFLMAEEEEMKKKIYDKILKISCPKCKDGKLVQLTSPREDFVVNSYKGLVYCQVCDFEVSKDEFDKKYGKGKND